MKEVYNLHELQTETFII